MHTYRNRIRSMLTALVLGAGMAAICGGTALADQPWTHAGNDQRGGYQTHAAQGNWRHHRDHHRWRQQADNHGWNHGHRWGHQRRGDWHPHHDRTRTAWGYRAYPPVTYAPPPRAYYAPPAPTYYAPPALSFGINIPLGGQDGH